MGPGYWRPGQRSSAGRLAIWTCVWLGNDVAALLAIAALLSALWLGPDRALVRALACTFDTLSQHPLPPLP